MSIATVKRNSSLDILRIIATLMVIMIHCSAAFVVRYEVGTVEFLWANILDSVSRIGVPLFVMISGALFLDESREITLKRVLSKNVLNLGVITLIWAVIYSVRYQIIAPLEVGNAINTQNVFMRILNGHYHMWYLYMTIGLYLMVPFFKKIVRKENKHLVLFFIIFSFVVQSVLPTISSVLTHFGINTVIMSWIGKFQLEFFGGYITYFLAGWYIVHIGINSKWVRYLLYVLGALSLAFVVVYVHYTKDYNQVYGYLSAPVFLIAIAFFLAVNQLKLSLKEKTALNLGNISKITFGVYLVHILILDTFAKELPYKTNPLLYILIEFVAVTAVSFLVAFIISKIPLIKKIIKA